MTTPKTYGGYSRDLLLLMLERGEELPGWCIRALLDAAAELERREQAAENPLVECVPTQMVNADDNLPVEQ